MATKQPYCRLFVLVLFLVVFAIGCFCTSVGHTVSTNEEGRDYKELKVKAKEVQDKAAEKVEEAKDIAAEKAKDAQDRAAEKAKEAKEASETWAEWAKEKISEGLGLKHDDHDIKDTAKKASDMASDTAKKTEDKVQEVASG